MNEIVATGVEPICWQGLVFLGWLVGMLILLALLVQRLCFVKALVAQSKPANERLIKILNECRCRIGIRRNIELRLSDNKFSPAVCGLFKPVILMPADLLEKLSPEKLKTVLIHELAHIKRADVWVNLLQTMLQIVYFYNPLVWIANAMIRRTREQAVDEMVLVTLKPETKSYSNTLIDIAEMAFWRPNFSLRLIGVVESKKALERRINHMLNRPVPKSSKLGILGLFAIIIIGAIILPMACGPARQTTLETPQPDKIIVPGLRVGKYTFDMTRDDVLESLGKPNLIFYGEERYTLDNLPGTYYMVFDNVSFRILDDSVKEIAPISPFYRFANGLGVGDSEKKIKQAFGDNFHIKETRWKDFLSYEDKGLVFEIDKSKRTVMEISVLPVESLQSYEKADIPPTSTINEHGHIVDKTDYPFVNDSQAIGGWKSVDFVRDIDSFDPTKKTWQGDLYLNNLIFEQGGSIAGNILTWTKGLVLSDDTASKYIIREIDGSTYMFFEWKSGDYTVRQMRPQYYVLRKVLTESLKYEPMFGKKAYIPPTSTINKQGHIVDKIDYPFVDDPKVIGSWKSVDFVGEIEQFKIGEQRWTGKGGKLFLHEMIFVKNGRLISKNGNAPGGYPGTWTKGLVFYNNDTVTASKYTLKNMDGSTYMFYEWKSGDYTFRHRKPSYYVLKKVSSETGGLAQGWASQPGDAEFAKQLPAKIEQLDIDTAELEQVKDIFGKPAQYIWGKETFAEDNLPWQYILVYPSDFSIYMRENQIIELRLGSGSNYLFRNKLRSGSTLDEVFEVIGHPKKTVEGEKNSFEDAVLFKDIDGTKGHCYYARSD
ncbi:MAG: M56 family metallopeptidase, partial [Planctomycetota bacterium]